MPDHPQDAEAYAEFRSELYAAGLLYDTGVDGLYGRSATYEQIVESLHQLVSSTIVPAHASRAYFPPVLARWVFDKTDYLKSFPDLMGSIHTFRGSDREHAELVRRVEADENWAESLGPAEVVLCSATCHPLYPMSAGTLPDHGKHYEVYGYCFRCEPSIDPTRMQAFRMQESVYIGDAATAEAHREDGLERGTALLSGLGLDVKPVVANDPFFGRLGTMLAQNQVEEALKIEVVTPVCSDVRPTAIMSANYHRDHFGLPFGIETASGEVAESACVAFGLDRVALALLHTHGLVPGNWPKAVRTQLSAW